MNQHDADSHRYDDIIHLPHHVSRAHPPMPAADRAAQFSPFAALTGHEAAIRETARLTDERAELDENAKAVLDEKLSMIQEMLPARPEITVTYFQPDAKKSGGAYVSVTGRVKKLDLYGQCLLMEDGLRIPLGELYDMDGRIFGIK
ncbi:hypothetical protein [Enterocloster asparagiformis]|uniref:hypothetical protein n=1 Tax=Enterocloster asparagiformis TaxID=333367 RepID=UPI00046789C0|nr:hypothetical protein [Enterocloster asparagiformis]